MEVIQELLTNSEPSVLGVALFAFQEVCPLNFELLHPHFRKICHLLADFDEWGQVVAVNVLTRYARYNFSEPPGYAQPDAPAILAQAQRADFKDLASPSQEPSAVPAPGQRAAAPALSRFAQPVAAPFYSDDEPDAAPSEDDDDDDLFGLPSASSARRRAPVSLPLELVDAIPGGDVKPSPAHTRTPVDTRAPEQAAPAPARRLDPDLAMLLRAAQALLHSPSAAVVLAVAALYQAFVPATDLPPLVRALVRHSRGTRTVSYVVLATANTLAARHPALFKPYLADFFVAPTDPRYVRELKLDILARLVDRDTAPAIVAELRAYCRSLDKDVVCRALQTLCRVAYALPATAAQCLRILIALADSPHAAVAAQALASTRLLLQRHAEDVPVSVLKLLCRLLDRTTEPHARATLVWLVGEHRARIPTLAPDVLRVLARSFAAEAPLVKLQVLTLAVKLYMADPPRVALLFKYVMDLCKYDPDCDLRDRARVVRTLFFKRKGAAAGDEPLPEAKEALKVLLCVPRPVPEEPQLLKERDRYQLGSLSHLTAHRAQGYAPLPPFPAHSSDPALRSAAPAPRAQPAIVMPSRTHAPAKAAPRAADSFYSDESESDSEPEPEPEPAAPADFFGDGAAAGFFAGSGAAQPAFDSFFFAGGAEAASPVGTALDLPLMSSPQANDALGAHVADDEDLSEGPAQTVDSDAGEEVPAAVDSDYDQY
jgi:AP-3 complex subunit beta